MINSVYLLIGGNLGDRIINLATCRKLIEAMIGKIIKVSSVYETASWGIADQPKFLNQVLFVKTKFSPVETIQLIHGIENKMGRIRTQKNASRDIDIDILFFNDAVVRQQHLTIPHPEIQNRKFVLIPLHEIAPGLIHPVFKRTVNELLSTTKDTLEVTLLNE